MIKFGLESLKEWRLGNLLYNRILHLCNGREKACRSCGWKHQCKCYYAFPALTLAADISQRRLTVSGKAGLLSIGWPVSHDPTACTHVNHPVNCCVKSFLHPLVNLQCDISTRNRLDIFKPHLPFGQPIQEPEVAGGLRTHILTVSDSHAKLCGLCSLTGTPSASLFSESLFTFVLRVFMSLHDDHSAAAQTASLVAVISPDLIKSLATHCVWIIYVVKM